MHLAPRRPCPANSSSGRAFFLCLIVLPLLCLPVTAAPPEAKKIDAAVERALRLWHVPGVAVAVVREGKVIYLAGHGVREIGRKEAITPDTLFPIASCTKGFTTTALAILQDEGKLHWDDHVREHVPFFRLGDPLADREVRLRDLVCHRTGLAGHDLLWYRSPWTQEEIIRRAGLLPLDKPFRTAFQYQSIMFTATGFAVARASGMSWADFVRQRLFEPLDMKSSLCSSRDILPDADRASPHRLGGGEEPYSIPAYPLDVPDSAGSIQSTARDLARWLVFQMGDGTAGGRRIVSAKGLAQLHTPQISLRMDRMDEVMFPETHLMSYGMGWVIQDHRGWLLWQHAGAIDGFRVHFTLVPRAKLGLVLLNNLYQTRMNIALSNTLLDLLLDLPPHDWHERILAAGRREREEANALERERLGQRFGNSEPSLPQAAYVGEYEHPAYGTVRVTLDGDTLRWRWNRFRARLGHYHFDTFYLDTEELPGTRVSFVLDGKGKVERMKVTGAMNVEFVRK
jgi:CubicO group peptidase (beta-lactamase class C family)